MFDSILIKIIVINATISLNSLKVKSIVLYQNSCFFEILQSVIQSGESIKSLDLLK